MKKVNIDRLIEHLRSRDPLPALFRLDENGVTVRVPQTVEERQRMLECWDDHKESTSPKLEGGLAFERGIPWNACPYPQKMRQQRSAWRSGWRLAAEKAGKFVRKHDELRVSAAEYYRNKRDGETFIEYYRRTRDGDAA